jgi:Wzt C-terminal domain
LCKRSLILHQGHIILDADTDTAVERYQAGACLPALSAGSFEHITYGDGCERKGTGKGRFLSARLISHRPDGLTSSCMYPSADLALEILVGCETSFVGANVAMIIYDRHGYRVIDANTALKGRFLTLEPNETATVHFRLRDVLLRPGDYTIGLWLGRGGIEEIDSIEAALAFTVETQPTCSRHTELFPGVYQCRFTVATDRA